MTYLTDEERHALQESLKLSTSARNQRAGDLINPASGLANDYLNLFNEIVMLVEQLPMVPEFIEDIMAWRPTTYRDYFLRSNLPGRETALEAYDRLDVRFRKNFENLVEELDRRSTGSVAAVRRAFKHMDSDPENLSVVCERAGANIREVLEKAAMLVDHGGAVRNHIMQDRTDEIMRHAV